MNELTSFYLQGYGFNLHAEKDKPGQYIGLVDDNSPASTGGLKANDRIIEVNGVNIEQEAHTEVIARVKAVPGETKLLVVDKETDNYYKEKGETISSSMPQTEHISTPVSAGEPCVLFCVDNLYLVIMVIRDKPHVNVRAHHHHHHAPCRVAKGALYPWETH